MLINRHCLEYRRCWRGKRIGILGGSFNPAHLAHRALSLYALKSLRLDAVWWLVAKQNPLKSSQPPAEHRLASALQKANHRQIFVCDIESSLPSNYTYHTLLFLRHQLPGSHLVWLMGSDNLVNFTKWFRWQQILSLLPIAVLRRPGSSLSWNGCQVAQKFRPYLIPWQLRHSLARVAPPAWLVCRNPLSPISSTALRNSSS